MKKTPFPVMIDSCTFIDLSKFLDDDFDNSGIREELLSGTFNSSKYIGLRKKFLPPLLQDSILGKKILTQNGTYIYANLINLANFAKLIISGEIQVEISPVVLGELNLTQNTSNIPFFMKYCKAVSVDEKDALAFMTAVDNLAEIYVKYGAMRSEFSAKLQQRVPANDAYIMAQATILKRYLISSDSHFFKTCSICSINESEGYIFAKKDPATNKYNTPRRFRIGDFLYTMQEDRLALDEHYAKNCKYKIKIIEPQNVTL